MPLTYLHRQIPHDEVKVRFCQELLLHPVLSGFVLVREGFSPTQNLIKANLYKWKMLYNVYFEHILVKYVFIFLPENALIVVFLLS